MRREITLTHAKGVCELHLNKTKWVSVLSGSVKQFNSQCSSQKKKKKKSICASVRAEKRIFSIWNTTGVFAFVMFRACLCACASFFGRGHQIWAFAMLSQQDARAMLEGTDGLDSFSPWFTIQIGRKRHKEPERKSLTERERGKRKKKRLKKGTVLLQSWEDTKNWKYKDTTALPAQSSG